MDFDKMRFASITLYTFSGLILTDVKELDTPLHGAFHKCKNYSFVYQIIFIRTAQNGIFTLCVRQ